jgi:hypothetical protein
MIAVNPRAVDFATLKPICANVLEATVVLTVQGRWSLVEVRPSTEISTTWRQPIHHCPDSAAVCWPTEEVRCFERK